MSFVSDTSAIFVYALLSHSVDEYRQLGVEQLRTLVHVCLYLSVRYVESTSELSTGGVAHELDRALLDHVVFF